MYYYRLVHLLLLSRLAVA